LLSTLWITGAMHAESRIFSVSPVGCIIDVQIVDKRTWST